jgi:cobalt-zinc-cadmium efflux system protein
MHSHHHHHHNSCDHTHVESFGKQFFIGVLLNSIFVIVELYYGFASKSLALVSDAWHNLGDVLGLLLAWGAIFLAKVKPNQKYTYGLQSSTIFAAILNSTIILLAVGGILVEAFTKILHPEHISSKTMIIVAGVGIIINSVTAFLFLKGAENDLNLKAVFYHMATDALISLGVVVSGIVIYYTNLSWVDSLTGILIGVIIIFGSVKVLIDAINLALHAVPKNIDINEVRSFLLSKDKVDEIHDLHIWAMSTNENSISVHLLMKKGHPGDDYLNEIASELEEKFRIGHATIQVEQGDGTLCKVGTVHN